MVNTDELIRIMIRETGASTPEGEESNNWVHTHNRVRYYPETHTIVWEEVCINEYGSCYGINRWGDMKLPEDMPPPVWWANWTDLEA